jgi:hypothetical protein
MTDDIVPKAPSTPSGQEIISNDELAWVPLHWVVKWKDGSSRDHVTIALLLPSGIATEDTDKVDVAVTDDGLVLTVKVPWPELLFTIENLETCWSSIVQTEKDFILMMAKTQQDLTSLRRDNNLRQKDAIVSIARIPLPEEVEREIETIKPIAGEDEERLLHVTCRVRVTHLEEAEHEKGFARPTKKHKKTKK